MSEFSYSIVLTGSLSLIFNSIFFFFTRLESILESVNIKTFFLSHRHIIIRDKSYIQP